MESGMRWVPDFGSLGRRRNLIVLVVVLAIVVSGMGLWSMPTSRSRETGSLATAPSLAESPLATIVSFTASPNPTDVGTSTTFSVIAQGGLVPYSYAYAGLPPGCTSSDTNTLVCAPTTSGTYIVRAYVNDSIPSSTSATLSLTVNRVPFINSFTATPNPTNVGINTTLAVVVSWGSSPFSYDYTGLPTGCATANTSSLVCMPYVSGTFSIRVFVNDSGGRSVNSATSLTVNPSTVTISSVAVSPATTTLGPGSYLTFTAVLVCSATCPPGITYSWTLTNNAMGSLSGASGATVVFTAGGTPGTVGLFVNATLNSNTKQGTPAVITIVIPVLNSVAISPSTATVVSGGAQPFTANPTCNVTCPSSISYSWTLSNGAMGSFTGSGNSVDFTAGITAGTVGLFVNATLNSNTKEGGPAVITVKVPTVTSVLVSPTTAMLVSGNAQTFSAIPTCNVTCPSSIAYSWALTNPAMGLIASSGSAVNFTAGNTAGAVGLFVNATLNSNTKEGGPAVITITLPILTSVAVNPAVATLLTGGTQNFTAIPTCSATCPLGTTYSWNITNGTMGTLNGTTGPLVSLNADGTAGTVGLFVNATLNGITEQSSPSIITIIILAVTSVAVGPSTASLQPGNAQNFTATPACNTICPSSIAYSWSLTNRAMGTLITTGASANFTAGTTVGTVGLFVNATLNGFTAQSSPVIISIAKPIVPTLTSVTISQSSVTVDQSGTASFSATPKCTGNCPSGTTYSWTLTSNAMGTLTPSGASVIFTAGNTLGTVGLFVNATLNAIGRQSSPTIITITGPTLTSLSLSPTTSILIYGGAQTFTAAPSCTLSCPTSEIAFAWTLTNSAMGSLAGSSASAIFTAGSTAGTVGLFINATLNGVTKESSAEVTIAGTSTISISTVTIAPGTASVSTGETEAFAATPACINSGGSSTTCPSGITYTWSLTNSLGKLISVAGSGATFSAGSKTGTVTLFVNASLDGKTVGGSATITIKQSSTTRSGLSWWLWAVIVAIAAIAILVAFVLVSRNRRKKKGIPEAAATPPVRSQQGPGTYPTEPVAEQPPQAPPATQAPPAPQVPPAPQAPPKAWPPPSTPPFPMWPIQPPPPAAKSVVAQPSVVQTTTPPTPEVPPPVTQPTIVVPPAPVEAAQRGEKHESKAGRMKKEFDMGRSAPSQPAEMRPTPAGQELNAKIGVSMTPLPEKCFICGSKLEGDYCRVCNMHWITATAPSRFGTAGGSPGGSPRLLAAVPPSPTEPSPGGERPVQIKEITDERAGPDGTMEPVKRVFCESCGRPMSAKARFCRSCGRAAQPELEPPGSK